MKTRAQKSKDWRERNRRKGRCVGCTHKAQDGLALCRKCRKVRSDFQEQRKASGMCFRCSNPAAYNRKKCLSCVLKVALYDLRRKGLIDAELVKAGDAFFAYGGICQACGLPIKPGNERFDHDDKRKKFRGIVHHGCNVVLGFGGENPALLRKLADYLETHSAN